MSRQPGEDRFVLGANLPWVNYVDFGSNAWKPDGGVGSPPSRERALEALSVLRDVGAELVRWWVMGDGRAGLIYGPDGGPTGLDDRFFGDLDTALDMVANLRLQLIPVLLDYLWCWPAEVVDGVQIQGRSDVLRQPDLCKRLFDFVVSPILERYGHDPTILAWEVINEPELATVGLWPALSAAAIEQTRMRSFIAEAVDLIHSLTQHGATVGSASASRLHFVRDVGLDLYQAHWYDANDSLSPLETPVSTFKLDAPIILGEFPTKNSQRTAGEIYTTAREAGYSGVIPWSLLGEDDFTDRPTCEAFLKAVTSA
jgi:hypothetical protein